MAVKNGPGPHPEEIPGKFRELCYATPDRETFNRGRTPKAVRKYQPAPNAKAATNKEIVEWVDYLPGTLWYSLYWTVYQYQRYDEDLGPSGRADYDTAIFNNVFFELEHQECGVLCEHTLAEARSFLNWCEEENLEALALYSGGKSIHIYLPFMAQDVPYQKKQFVIKRVSEIVIKASAVKLYDPVVLKTGRSQVARIPGTLNSDSGNRCALLVTGSDDYDDFKELRVNDIIRKARNKNKSVGELETFLRRHREIRAERDNWRLAKMTRKQSKKDPPKEEQEYEIDEDQEIKTCITIEKIKDKNVPKGERYYHTLVLIDYWRAQGHGPNKIHSKLIKWAKSNNFKLDSSKVRADIRYRFEQGPPSENPCAWLVNIGIRCPQCLGDGQ